MQWEHPDHPFVNKTLSNHHGVSSEYPDTEEVKQTLSSFIPMKEEFIYSQVFSTEQCVLSPWQSNLFGFNDSSFDIRRVIEMIHPMDMDKVWDISRKALDRIYSPENPSRRFIFRCTYRMLSKGHRYIRVLRETAPLSFDRQGKLIHTISRVKDISQLGHKQEIKGWLVTAEDETINLTDETRHKISAREKEVLRYLTQGYSSQKISNHLNISKLTVDKHRANMLKKTNTRNTSELIHYALEQGILE